MRVKLSTVLLLFCVACLLPRCGSEHRIVGAFQLEQWEDGKTYYLHKRGYDDSRDGGSILGGVTRQVGWNSRFILAERYSFYRGDPDGWMIIDAQSGTISGPFTDAEIRSHPETKGIQTYEADEAWRRL